MNRDVESTDHTTISYSLSYVVWTIITTILRTGSGQLLTDFVVKFNFESPCTNILAVSALAFELLLILFNRGSFPVYFQYKERTGVKVLET